jgi:hypothetical protein
MAVGQLWTAKMTVQLTVIVISGQAVGYCGVVENQAIVLLVVLDLVIIIIIGIIVGIGILVTDYWCYC